LLTVCLKYKPYVNGKGHQMAQFRTSFEQFDYRATLGKPCRFIYLRAYGLAGGQIGGQGGGSPQQFEEMASPCFCDDSTTNAPAPRVAQSSADANTYLVIIKFPL
jgi:hypothetical protein